MSKFNEKYVTADTPIGSKIKRIGPGFGSCYTNSIYKLKGFDEFTDGALAIMIKGSKILYDPNLFVLQIKE